MEIFEVQYKGKKLTSIKLDESNIYVKMPVKKLGNGDQIHESITRDSEGWKYSLISLNNFDRALKLWIRDDDTIGCYDNNTDKIVVTKKAFNPDSPNMGKLNSLIIELYKVVEQLRAYEKRNIPASTIIKLRKANLMSTLSLLGYSSIESLESELDDSKVYFSLGRIGKQLEDYINLGAYVHVDGKEKDEDVIRLNLPDGMTREEFLELVEPVKNEYSSNLAFITEQDEKMDQKRGVVSDYCEGSSKKMSYSDWLIYTRMTKETAQLLLELNADLLSQNGELEMSDLSKLTGTDLKDRISRLINSRDFVKACDIENRFRARESQRLVEEVEHILSDEEIRGTPMAKALKDIEEEEKEFIRTAKEEPKKPEGVGIND